MQFVGRFVPRILDDSHVGIIGNHGFNHRPQVLSIDPLCMTRLNLAATLQYGYAFLPSTVRLLRNLPPTYVSSISKIPGSLDDNGSWVIV